MVLLPGGRQISLRSLSRMAQALAQRSSRAPRLSTIGLLLLCRLLPPVEPFLAALSRRTTNVGAPAPSCLQRNPRPQCIFSPKIACWAPSDRWRSEEESSSIEQSQIRPHQPRRRRELLLRSAAFLGTSLALPLSLPTLPSYARGLVQFPCTEPLLNTYHLMRAGTSLLESQDIWSTNPLFLTNREDALSPEGEVQVVKACDALRGLQRAPTVVRYSLAASCTDAATVVSRELRLGRDRVVAEYTYLDPRAIGRWDMGRRSRIEPAIWALDEYEAGADGTGGRPPPNDDGTPHETLADQAVRLRQLLSVLETLYSGDTVLLIFPDGTGPALLSALVAGVPLNRVHRLEFAPGEVRLDVTRDSVAALYASRESDPDARDAYERVVKQGRDALRELRGTDPELYVSRKDQQIEEERLKLEQEFQEKQRRQKEARDAQQAQRLERQRQLEATRGPSPSAPVLLGVAGTVAAGGVAVAVAPSDNGWEPKGAALVSPGPSPPANGTVEAGTSGIGRVEAGDVRTYVPGSSSGTAGGLYGEGRQRVNGEGPGATTVPAIVPPVTIPDRREAARLAMEEYLDRDDGAGDWLQSLADILHEDEVEDDAEDDAM